MAGDLFRAMYQAMTGGVARRTPEGTDYMTGGRGVGTEGQLRRMLNEMERAHGSVREAAREVGVSESTWRRWRSGASKPKPGNVDKVRQGRRRTFTDPERQADFAGGAGPGGAMTVSGWVLVSNDERPRTIPIGPYLDGDAALDAYLRGDDEALDEMLQDALDAYIKSGGGPGGSISDPVFHF